MKFYIIFSSFWLQFITKNYIITNQFNNKLKAIMNLKPNILQQNNLVDLSVRGFVMVWPNIPGLFWTIHFLAHSIGILALY